VASQQLAVLAVASAPIVSAAILSFCNESTVPDIGSDIRRQPSVLGPLAHSPT
jgi:hypothetical protein